MKERGYQSVCPDVSRPAQEGKKMVFELENTEKVIDLFAGWKDTMITSCIQKVMGKIYVTDRENPRSAFAFAGCFGFFAGEPDEQLVRSKPEGFTILVPQDARWEALIEMCFPKAERITRYAIRKDTEFDREDLRRKMDSLPAGYELRKIDSELYDRCLESPVTADFVSSFESKEKFLQLGRGWVITKNGEIVSGASSYSRYREGIEIEVDTVKAERRKHLAAAACAALILDCLEEGLYPSWDAQNTVSVHLAETLGYVFDHEYTAYEVI